MTATANREANRELRDRLAEVHQRYARLRSDLDDLQKRLEAVRVTVVSADGLVRVTVGPRGQLIDLKLTRRATRNMDNEYVSRTIVSTVHNASQEAAERVQTLMGDYLPSHSGALRYLRDHNFGSLLGRSDEIVQDLAGRDDE